LNNYFRNLMSTPQPVDMTGNFEPNWKNKFTPSGYFDFLGMLLAYLRTRKIDFALKVDALVLEKTGDQIELLGLAQTCASQDRREWRNTIATHFEGLNLPLR
jgi:hypothetical protein